MRSTHLLILAICTLLAACADPHSGKNGDGGIDAPNHGGTDGAVDAAGPLGNPTGNFIREIHTTMGVGSTVYSYAGIGGGNANTISGSFLAGDSGTIAGMPWTGFGLVTFGVNGSDTGLFANSLSSFSQSEHFTPDINFFSQAEDSSGDLYLCGGFNQASVTFNTVANGMVTLTNLKSLSGEPADMLIKVQGTTGLVLWATTLATDNSHSMYGTAQSICRSVSVSGTAVVAGYAFSGSVAYSLAGVSTPADASGPTDFDGLLTVIDPATGKTLWAKHLGGSSIDSVYSVSIDGSGNVYMGANSESGTPTIDGVAGTTTNTVVGSLLGIIYEFDATTHAITYSTAFHPTVAANVIINALGAAPNGDIVACGWYGGQVDFGLGAPTNGDASDDGFVLRVSKTTGTEWVDAFDGDSTDTCNSLAIDSTDEVVIGISYGYSASSVMIDTHALPAATIGKMAGSAVKLSSAGKYLWSQDMVGTNADVWSVAILPSHDVVAAGAFTGNIDLGDGVVNGGDTMSASYFAVVRGY